MNMIMKYSSVRHILYEVLFYVISLNFIKVSIS